MPSHSSVDPDVTEQDDQERQGEAKDVHAQNVRPEVVGAGEVVECTRRLKPLQMYEYMSDFNVQRVYYRDDHCKELLIVSLVIYWRVEQISSSSM